MIFTRHSSFYHLCSYHVCDLNLLLDFRFFLFIINLALTLCQILLKKKGGLNKPYYFMHSSYMRELQGNSKLKIAFSKYLKEKKHLEKKIRSRLSDVSSGEVLLQTKLIRPGNSFY